MRWRGRPRIIAATRNQAGPNKSWIYISPTHAASAPALIAPSPSLKRALERFGAPIYVRHQVVHNKYVVVKSLSEKGAVFVEEFERGAGRGSTVIFSAHGVSKGVRQEAETAAS